MYILNVNLIIWYRYVFVHIGVVVNYFFSHQGEIVTTFLSLVPLESGNALCIAEGVRNKLKELKLNIKNLIEIGTDNASVMVRRNRSVFTELRKDAPSTVLINCVFHSVQLAINQACRDGLEFLTYETCNWFCKSSSRQSEYKTVYQSISNYSRL